MSLFTIQNTKAKTEFKEYVSAVDGNMEMESLGSYILEAMAFIRQVVDDETLYDIITNFKADDLTEPQEKLLPYIRKPLADFSIYQWSSRGNLKLNDSGIMMVMTANEKPAFQYMTNELKDDQLESGYAGLELLQQFLEENASDFPMWQDSPKSTLGKEFIIRKADEFSNYININNSRRTFTALMPLMRNVEFMQLEKYIGAAQLKAFKDAYYGEEPSDILKKAVESYLKPAFARYVMADALYKLPMIMRADSILIKEYEPFSDATKAQRKPDKDSIIKVRDSYLDEASNYMSELIIYMDANTPATNFTDYNTDKRLPRIALGETDPNKRTNPSIFSAL